MTKTLPGEPLAGFTQDLAQACTAEDEKRVSELVASWVRSAPPPFKRNLEMPKTWTKEDVISQSTFMSRISSSLVQVFGISDLAIIKCFMKRTKHTRPAHEGRLTDYILDAFVKAENIEVLDFLMLEYKWDINKPRSIVFPSHLGLATQTNNLKLIQWFLDHGADPNAFHDRLTDQTPMSFAASASIETMEFMIKAGGDVHRGSTLHYAISSQWRHENGMVKFLLDRGVDPNVIEYSQCPKAYNYQRRGVRGNKFGTPLHTAIFYLRFEQTELLLQYGADPNIKDVRGFTPMQRLQDVQAHIEKTLAENERKRKNTRVESERLPHLTKRLASIERAMELIRMHTKVETSDACQGHLLEQNRRSDVLEHSGSRLSHFYVAWLVYTALLLSN